MPREFSRAQRIADQLQKDLASILQLEVRDPRVGMVTINDVKVSHDLSYADIYITFMGIDESIKSFTTATKILNQAAGYLRTRLSKALRLRFVPNLRFHYDESLLRGQRLNSLIDQVIREDENKPVKESPANEEPNGKT